MAKIKTVLLKLSGRIGDMVIVTRNGNSFIRTIPESIKQTLPTKQRSSNFGLASATGKIFRFNLQPVIPFPKDKEMQNDLVGAIAKWLKITKADTLLPSTKLPFIFGFGFNKQSGLREKWRISLTVTQIQDNLLELHIPAFVPVQRLFAPANTVSVDCTITTAACHLVKGTSAGNYTTHFMIPYTGWKRPEQLITLPIPTAPGNIIITAVSLTYILDKKGIAVLCNDPAFMPAEIIGAMYC